MVYNRSPKYHCWSWDLPRCTTVGPYLSKDNDPYYKNSYLQGVVRSYKNVSKLFTATTIINISNNLKVLLELRTEVIA